MKLKHVLFSGLLLSAGLTACTNEELIDVQTPSVNTEDGIALGEGITIVGTKGNIGTRAEFADDFSKALWESDDVIGAAWYNMITSFNPVTGAPATSQSFQISGNNVFASNTWFKFDKQVGEDMSSAQFKSDANLMAGAYVLYYPYDDAIKTSADFDGIPVAMEYNQTMDCKAGNELAAVNENIFAYSIQPFVNGGAQTTTFKLNQLNNVFAIRFMVTKPGLMILEKPVGIKKVIIKAVDNSGNSVLTATGKISVPSVTTVDYVNGKYGEAKFVAGTDAADQLILDVENADNNYAITEVGEAGATQKPFYISALPFHSGIKTFTVQILTDDNKVYSTSYDAASEGTLFSKVEENAVKEGQQINLNVVLDKLEDEALIYNAEQFNEQWQAVLDGTKKDALQIADALDLSDVDLTIDKPVAMVITGKSLKVKSLNLTNGSLAINNDALEVAGDMTVGSNVGEVNGTGTLSVDGTLTVKGGEEGDMDLTVAKVGELVTEKSGIISLTGTANAVLNDVTNEGQLTLNNIAIAKDATVANTGTITVGNAKVVNNGTIVNEEDGTFEIGANEFTNKGTFEQKGEISTTKTTGKFVNNGILNVNADTKISIENAAADATKGLAAGEINVEEGTLSTASGYTITNKSTINVNKGTLTEGAASTLIQTDAAARINVSENGTISFNKTKTGVTAGFVMTDADANVINGTSDEAKKVLAETVTTVEELNTATATNLYITGNLEIASLPASKNMYLAGGTLTLTTNVTVSGGSIIVVGDVAIAAKDAQTGATLTLYNYNSNNNKVLAGGKLTLGKGVTLNADNATNLVVEAGGDFVRGEGTVGANVTVKY